MERRRTGKTTLLRLGFTEPEQASVRLGHLGLTDAILLAHFGDVPDPDLALDGLGRLVDAASDADELLAELHADPSTAARLLSVLGSSLALSDHLVRHPAHWHELSDADLATVSPPALRRRTRLLEAVEGLDRDQAIDALRVEYRRQLLRLAARDFGHGLAFESAGAELADLACAVLDAALTIAIRSVPDSDSVRLAIVAMGKTGGNELNYVSDVDVLFVHEPLNDVDPGRAATVAAALAAEVIKICGVHTAEGTIWEVDAALRPEGKAGALSRTLPAMSAYYSKWASTWEFQALLKARPAAGDLALGDDFVDAVAPLVWSASEREHFVTETQAMRRRVVSHVPAREAERELKLGDGGLRDVEFAVQLLQLVHGRTDVSLRRRSTMSALNALSDGGYIGRDDGRTLREAYTFLRRVEHRIQVFGLRRTHLLPTDEAGLRRLGRGLGFFQDPINTLTREMATHRREVRRLHEKLFYRPLLNAVAALPSSQIGLSRAEAGSRLRALGYADPDAALRHLAALTQGVSRTADIQRQLLPVLLQWFAEGPDPDAGLLGFRKMSETLGSTPWYLRTLRDEGLVAQRLAHLLSRSRYATDLLEREPEGVRMLGDELVPRSVSVLVEEMSAGAARRTTLEESVRSIRAVRRRELLRISAGDVDAGLDLAAVGSGLSALTDATIGATLNAACDSLAGGQPAPADLAVVAMGRYGGSEMSYASDADVLFVHRPRPGADPAHVAIYVRDVVTQVRRLLAASGHDPSLELDADLRPEGRSGPLVRSLDSYRAYYIKWTEPWERQALLRARPAAGNTELLDDLFDLINPIRYYAGGLSTDELREIRRIKGRIETERMPRSADPKTHFKLGRGGLADVEWTVQLLQLRHSDAVAGLRTPSTLTALAAAVEADLISADDAQTLTNAWTMVSRIRDAIVLARGRPSEQMPTNPRERQSVAALLGYADGEVNELINDHLRLTRLAAGVVDRVFWEQ